MSDPDLTERGIVELARRAAAGTTGGVQIGIGDDCAVLVPEPGMTLVATTDLVIEDVHFRRRHAEPADIGWKSLAVNLSDVASMGGRPRWALLALACPESTTADEVEAFYEGFLVLAREHEVALVGGDTSLSPHGWVVNVTALGEARRPILRATARDGDVIAVTGTLGRSAAGLALLERDISPTGVAADMLADVAGAHRRPSPRVAEGRWFGESGLVTAMIDVSDGLATDAAHIAEESRVGARIDVSRVPISASTRSVADALGADALAWATGGGEDYELLLTCAPSALARLSDGLERATGTRLVAIGEVTAAPPGVVTFVDANGAPVAVGSGFQHFGRHA